MRKVKLILGELFAMMVAHRVYFLAPLFLVLALISFLVYYVGPAVIVTFIYAGV